MTSKLMCLLLRDIWLRNVCHSWLTCPRLHECISSSRRRLDSEEDSSFVRSCSANLPNFETVCHCHQDPSIQSLVGAEVCSQPWCNSATILFHINTSRVLIYAYVEGGCAGMIGCGVSVAIVFIWVNREKLSASPRRSICTTISLASSVYNRCGRLLGRT
jgi:hypothetical protein